MKKYLTLMAMAIIFLSCKKENASNSVNNNPALSKTLYPVSFNLSAFETTEINKSKTVTNSISTMALKDQIKYLHYAVFSAPSSPGNELVLFKQIVQNSTQPSFGTILDSLPAGKYSIFFVGAQHQGSISMKDGAPVFDPAFFVDDTFNKRVDLTITDQVKQSVVLNRISAMITITFTDIMPANAGEISVEFEDSPPDADLLTNEGHLHPSDTSYFSRPLYVSVIDTDKGKTGFTLSTFVWPYQYPSITIDCIGLNGELISRKKLSNILPKFLANKNYIFSGKLLEQQTDFNITIKDKWNPPVNVPFNLPSQMQ
jgi:hypothetical protein